MTSRLTAILVAATLFATAETLVADHDDPIVFDNGPFRVLLGASHKPVLTANGWQRSFTSFSQLVVTVVDWQDRTLPSRSFRLCSDCQVTFELRTSSGVQNSVTLSPAIADRTVSMTAEKGSLEQLPDSRLVVSGEDLRIWRIRATDSAGNPVVVDIATAAGAFAFKKVVAVLVPTPEAEHERHANR